MIRREITTANGAKLWLLVSQVEHAHMSGELARHWREAFTRDVVDAIAHHDDGWAAWEAEPKLNPETGAPFSFLEMPVPAALVIWDHSIAAAGEFGPLAAYIVAGHFYNLLNNSEHAKDPLAVAWLTAKRKHRTGWLDEWVRADPSQTLEYAKRAQQMLLVADLFSLWLCCDSPTDRNRETILGQSAMKLQTDMLFSQFQFSVQEFEIKSFSHDERIEALSWSVGVHPFPCRTAPISLPAECIAVPAVPYASWQELKAASWPVALRWRLVEDTSTNGSPT
ncbi:MAG: DUF3891 family protein [Planctomycetes bacterium]|nr:DUF3891 family protein [Planctomycetota bacterium]